MKRNGRMFIYIVLCFILAIGSFLGANSFRKKIQYRENGVAEYKVKLKENPYYDTDILSKNMYYIAGLVDYIDLNFLYGLRSDSEIDYKSNYSLETNLIIAEEGKPDNVIYTKKEDLAKNKTQDENGVESFAIEQQAKIKFNDYSKKAKEFISKYGITAKGFLRVSLQVDTDGNYSNTSRKINASGVITAEIPLTEPLFNITTKSGIDIPGTKSHQVMETPLSEGIRIASYVFLGVGVLLGIIWLVSLSKKRQDMTDYEREKDQIFHNYDKMIVRAKSDLDLSLEKELIEVETFEELLGISDRSGNPVLFLEKQNDEMERTGKFIVRIDDECYEYEIIGSDKREIPFNYVDKGRKDKEYIEDNFQKEISNTVKYEEEPYKVVSNKEEPVKTEILKEESSTGEATIYGISPKELPEELQKQLNAILPSVKEYSRKKKEQRNISSEKKRMLMEELSKLNNMYSKILESVDQNE
ncbi:MAG: DUF5305 domain-containing protein [Lachnospiraceae bacterium]|jgi:hypothetical protein|nr:DUF5305 domain-containing protein [Lachnospiraceae bacterium]